MVWGIFKKDTISDAYLKMKAKKADTVNEETEQLDELSIGALKSYIKGAKASKKFETDVHSTAARKNDWVMASDAHQTLNKRKEGIKAAKAKLNKEETETEAELSEKIIVDKDGNKIGGGTVFDKLKNKPISFKPKADDKEEKSEVKEAAEDLVEYESKDGVYRHQAKAGRYGGSEKENDYVKGPSNKDLEKIEKEKKKEKVEEAKAVNTQSARDELSKRPRKELTGKDAEDKKKESDDAWERLMAHAAAQGKPVKEEAAYKPTGSKSDSPGFQAYLAARRKAKEQKVVKEELEELEDGTLYDGSDMLGEAQARYSSSYQFTHKPGDAESEKKLSDLKAQHKGTGKRVVLQGRLGKDNPNAHKYSKANWGKPGSASSGAHTHQRIKKADAAHHDVYVYDKADTQYEYDSIISEVLSKDASAGQWISDFIKSDNPKFAGDSNEKRKERALAAYYAAQKNESRDFDFYAEYSEYIQEVAQPEIVKGGAKEIKHANMKDKQQHAEIMEPHSKGEADFLDQHSVKVTDDPTQGKLDAGKTPSATKPTGKGAGKYDGDSKLSSKDKADVKEEIIKGGKTATGGDCEEIDTTPQDPTDQKANAKKKFKSFSLSLGK
jgi:hypothetical protein